MLLGVEQPLPSCRSGHQVDVQGVAGIPVAGNLQDRRTAHAAVGKQHVFGKAATIARGGDLHRQAAQALTQGLHAVAEHEGDQASASLGQADAELSRDIVADAAATQGGNRQGAGGNHQRSTGDCAALPALGQGQSVPGRIVLYGLQGIDLTVGLHLDSRPVTLGEQHVDNVLRRIQAEQLAVATFFVGNAMLFDQGDEVPLGVAAQRRLAEMRIVRQEVVGFDEMIGEIAAPATGHEDLLADLVGPLQHQNATAPLGGGETAQQARGTRAENDNIVMGGG